MDKTEVSFSRSQPLQGSRSQASPECPFTGGGGGGTSSDHSANHPNLPCLTPSRWPPTPCRGQSPACPAPLRSAPHPSPGAGGAGRAPAHLSPRPAAGPGACPAERVGAGGGGGGLPACPTCGGAGDAPGAPPQAPTLATGERGRGKLMEL